MYSRITSTMKANGCEYMSHSTKVLATVVQKNDWESSSRRFYTHSMARHTDQLTAGALPRLCVGCVSRPDPLDFLGFEELLVACRGRAGEIRPRELVQLPHEAELEGIVDNATVLEKCEDLARDFADGRRVARTSFHLAEGAECLSIDKLSFLHHVYK